VEPLYRTCQETIVVEQNFIIVVTTNITTTQHYCIKQQLMTGHEYFGKNWRSLPAWHYNNTSNLEDDDTTAGLTRPTTPDSLKRFGPDLMTRYQDTPAACACCDDHTGQFARGQRHTPVE
jgi:hypothetical protein